MALAQSPATAPAPQLPATALHIPIVRQETNYSCGPAALRAVLRYFAVWDGPEAALYKVVDASPQQGSLPEGLAVGAHRFGLAATIEQRLTIPRLRSLLGAGSVVILELQAWRDAAHQALGWQNDWDDGHYVVLIAMDKDYAYVMDPSTGDAYAYLPLRELVERWHDINPVRKPPRRQRDLQLGVIVSGPQTRPPPLSTRRLRRLD